MEFRYDIARRFLLACGWLPQKKPKTEEFIRRETRYTHKRMEEKRAVVIRDAVEIQMHWTAQDAGQIA